MPQTSRFSALTDVLLTPDHTVREALEAIDRNMQGIVLVVDDNNILLDSLTDGDLRRAFLNGTQLDDSVTTLFRRKERITRPRPITAEPEASPSELIALMNKHRIQQVPIIDREGHVVGLHTLAELTSDWDNSVEAVVMAGGFGQRLRPLTDDTPKPMLPVGGRPLLEHIIKRLRDCGVQDVRVTTHYRPDVIQSHFKDGANFGVSIDYINEEQPLGTAGALRLLERPTRTQLVMNGDILTAVDFRKMKSYHDETNAALTMAVRIHETHIPYGVVDSENGLVTGLREKPILTHFVNGGIYMLEPRVFDHLGIEGRMDMTDLIEVLLANGEIVASFPMTEYWRDIGHHEDYRQAQHDFTTGLV